MAERAPRNPSETKLLICVNNPAPLWNPPPDAAERMRARFPQAAHRLSPRFHGFGPRTRRHQYLYGPCAQRNSPRARAKASVDPSGLRRRRAVHVSRIAREGVILTNASSVHCVPIAQHILGMIVALARRFPDCLRYQRQHIWALNELWSASVKPRELRDQVFAFRRLRSHRRETAESCSLLECASGR